MKSRKIFAIIVCALLVGCIALSATAAISSNSIKNDGSGGDDGEQYIKVSNNELGGQHYAFEITDAVGWLNVGDIRVIGDYMYVYGYFYSLSSSSTLATDKLTGWIKQPTALGWGCAAINRTKAVYGDPAGYIEDVPVVAFDHCFGGCSNMTALPSIPGTAASTECCFENCTSLTEAAINGMPELGIRCFGGCTGLTKVFISNECSSVASTAFAGTSDVVFYVQYASAPASFGTGWNSNAAMTIYGADAYRYMKNITETE